MAMISGMNGSTFDAIRALNRTQTAQATTQQRIASGKRINSAADDAAGLAISTLLSVQERGFVQASRNALDGVSELNVADGALSSQQESLGRLRDLAMQSANGALSDADRQAIQQEASGLVADLDHTAQSTQFNGKPLLSSTNTTSLQIGLGSGSGDQVNVTVNESTTSSLGLSGLDLSNPSSAQSALGTLDLAIGKVSDNLAGIGAGLSRLDSAYDVVGTQAQNTASSRSAIEDADLAKESADSVASKIRAQVSVAMLAQANLNGASFLKLLA
jgi:flagellin